MAKKDIYEVKSAISKDGKTYKAGDAIELTDDEAKAMPWAVAALEAPKKKEPTKPAGGEGGTGEDDKGAGGKGTGK